MINTKITVQFEDKLAGLYDNYWARIEVAPPELDTISIEEAATVIDGIFDIDPCNSDGALVGGNPSEPMEEEDIELALESGFGLIDYDPCKYDSGTFNFDATIYVYRSHPEFPYKLIINDGQVLQTEKITKRVSSLVKPDDDGTIDTKFPVLGNVECDFEVLGYADSTILVKIPTTSKYIKLYYDTEYDKVTVKVYGSDSATQEGTGLVFYKETVSSATIEPPVEDSKAINTIGCSRSLTVVIDEDEDEAEDAGVCYQRYIISSICECSGDIKNTESVVGEVPCPESPATPHSDTEAGAYNFWWENKKINTYVPCSEEAWEGATDDYYKDTCCETMLAATLNGNLAKGVPNCQHRTQSWLGGAGIIKGPDHYLDNAFHDEEVVLIPVGPEDGICGTIEYIQEVESKNCCDDPLLTPIVIDTEGSADVIDDFSYGIIYWEGGQAPYTIKVRGTGFYLTDGVDKYTTGTTNSTYAYVYTDEACGGANFTVDDGCSEATHRVLTTAGEWKEISRGDCENKGMKADYLVQAPGYPPNFDAFAFIGDFRYRQRLYVIKQTFDIHFETPCLEEHCWRMYSTADPDHCWGGDGWNLAGCISSTKSQLPPLVEYENFSDCFDDCAYSSGVCSYSGGTTGLYQPYKKTYGYVYKHKWVC